MLIFQMGCINYVDVWCTEPNWVFNVQWKLKTIESKEMGSCESKWAILEATIGISSHNVQIMHIKSTTIGEQQIIHTPTDRHAFRFLR